MSKEDVTALYLRISDEDVTANGDRESESIAGQRLLLTDFVRGRRELAGSTIIEIVDDGFSGTSFDRPGITKLMALVRSRQVCCVVVKDFSRFGRDYLEVGNYLEQVFPFLGIRFLSVNDGFDSFEGIGAAGAIEIGFKNILHQAYSKDLSEKIRSVRRLKAEQGKFITALAPYGFQKAEGEKNLLAIDEECAGVVRRIYDLYLDGMGKTAIARLLNAEQIPSPLMIRTLRNTPAPPSGNNVQGHWTASTIAKLLSDQRYVGDAVYGKVLPRHIGSKKGMAVPREKWIVVPNIHPCIINRNKFEAVQSRTRKQHYQRTKESAFSTKLLCRACNHALHRISTGEQAYYQCTTHRFTSQYSCFTGRLQEPLLEAVILSTLRLLMLAATDHPIEAQDPSTALPATLLTQWQKTEKAIDKNKVHLFLLYGMFREGKETEESFGRKTAAIESTLSLLTKQAAQLVQKQQDIIREGNLPTAAIEHMPFQNVTRETVNEFVEAFFVETDGRLSITWKFIDPFLLSRE